MKNEEVLTGEQIAAMEISDDVDVSEWTSTSGETVRIYSEAELTDDEMRQVLTSQRQTRAISGQLQGWAKTVHAGWEGEGAPHTRSSGLSARDKYVTPGKIFDQFKTARVASESDDVISNVINTTEALVFNKVRVECGDDDEENIWDQILRDIRLDNFLKQLWRDLFIYNQYYIAVLYGSKNYKVEGQGAQRARRKSYPNLVVPTALSLIDPLKIVPVGDFLFGKDKLAYIANTSEGAAIDQAIAGENTTDQVVTSLIKEKYVAPHDELRLITEMTGATNLQNLFLLDDTKVWRHTGTRPSYARFATIQMKAVFELLDLKQQLRHNDRAHLVASTNFIILIRKGSDEKPASNAELAALSASAQMASRSPLMVGDHRLDVRIITPPMEFTLDPKRYNNIDSRLTAALYNILHLGGFAAGASGDDSLKLLRVIARGLESRRRMIAENLEQNLLLPIFEMNSSLKCKPRLEFTPRNVALDFDPNFLRTMMELYNDGAISRETILGIVDHEQEEEFARREIEKERYDKIMVPRQMNNGQAGRKLGGEQNGGGENPDSKSPNPVPRRGDNDVPGEPEDKDK